MTALDKFETYRLMCREALKNGEPEAIQDIYALLFKLHSEYMLNFQHQFQGWVLNHFLLPAIKSPNQADVFLAWEIQNTAWKNNLQTALLRGNVGPAVNGFRLSLVHFAEIKESE